MTSTAAMLHAAYDAQAQSPCRSLSAPRSQYARGRAQRCGQGQCREASRGSPARLTSKSGTVAARSRSGTRCQRPSSEVQLRGSDLSLQETLDSSVVNDCASGFVCDLIDDAVDDFTDDLVHDVDDVYPSKLPIERTPVKAIDVNEAQLVLSTSEPAITEVDEDEDFTSAASMITSEAAEEALRFAVPNSPSLSMNVNVPSPSLVSHAQAKLDVVEPRKLELGQDDGEEDTEDTDDVDGYEEVYSLASESPEEAEEADEDIEALAYVQMAVSLAKNAVTRGCEEAVEEQAEAEDIARCNLSKAKAAARDSLRRVLLGEEVQTDESDAEDSSEGEEEEFLGEGPACGDEVAFDFASSMFDGAFEKAATTWEQEDEEDDTFAAEHLRLQARETFLKAVQTGELRAALEQQSEAKKMDDLRAKARQTLVDGVANGKFLQIMKERQMENLKTQVRKTLLDGISNGKFQQLAKERQMEVPKEDQLQALKASARDTLLKGVASGKFQQVLAERQENYLKASARETLLAGLESGRLQQLLEERRLEHLRSKARESLTHAAANRGFEQFFEERAEENEAAETKELKAKVRQTLLDGAITGRLEQLLVRRAAEKKAAKMDDLKAKVRQTMMAAAANGKFEKFLAERCETKKAQATGKASHYRRKTGLIQDRRPAVQAEAAKTQEEDDVLELRDLVRDTMLAGIENGQLDATLANISKAREAKKIESFKVDVRDTLRDSVRSGMLESCLAERAKAAKVNELKAQVRDTLLQAAKMNELKAQVRDTLLQAAQNGTLTSTLADSKAEAIEKKAQLVRDLKAKARETLLSAAKAYSEEDNSIEALKAKARDTLLKAAANMERDQREKELQKLRQKARDALSKAAQDGRLRGTLQEASHQEVDIKSQAPQALLKAASDGSLLATLQQIAPRAAEADLESDDKLDELRLKARAALENALFPESRIEDLKMKAQAALKNALFPESDGEDLRQKAQAALLAGLEERLKEQELKKKAGETLKEAARSGKLAAALTAVGWSKAAAPEENYGESLKAKVRQALCKGLHTGELSAAFKESLEADRMEAMRSQVRNTLAKAVETGAFANVVRDVMSTRAQVSTPSSTSEAVASPPPAADVQRSASLTQLPSKPSTARENCRPVRQSASQSKIEMARPEPLSSPTSKADRPVMSPSTPSRSRRRIIGGLTRGPSQLELQEPMPSPPPSASGKKKERKEKKEASTAFCVDLSAGEEPSVARDSSLTRGYDSLGAQFFSLADSPTHQKLTAFSRGSSEVDRPSSKTANRLRATTSKLSAMEMDLGFGEGSSASTRNSLPASAFKFDLKPLSFETKAPKMQISQSLGSLQVVKSKQGTGLLPTLSPQKNSAQALARTMQMSKTATKWSVVGLRGSASVGVF